MRYRRRLELSLCLGIFPWQALVLERILQGFAIVELSIQTSHECLADFCRSHQMRLLLIIPNHSHAIFLPNEIEIMQHLPITLRA